MLPPHSERQNKVSWVKWRAVHSTLGHHQNVEQPLCTEGK
jgi:hypothetical protein